MQDNISKAFDFAQESAKQLLTLATGIVALTVTLLTTLAPHAPSTARTYLYVSWAAFVVSVAGGVATLMMLAGNLERPNEGDEPSIYAGNIKLMAMIQAVAFGAGLVLTVVFGILALNTVVAKAV